MRRFFVLVLFGCAFAAYALSKGAQVISTDVNSVSATTGALTVYVDVDGGDDRNDCSMVSPCATVQAAIDRLPRQIYHPTTVKVAPGQYAGAYVEGFTVHPMFDAGAGYSSLWIDGTMVDFIPDAGNNSGVLTSAVAQSNATFAVLSDGVQTWVPNSLRGQFVEITSGVGAATDAGLNVIPAAPPIYPIISNTASDLTVLGVGALAAPDSGYRLVTPGSIFVAPASTNQPTPAALMWFNNTGYVYAVSRFGFQLGPTNTRGIATAENRLNGFVLKMDAASGVAAGVFSQSTPQAGPTIRQSYFAWPAALGSVFSYSTSGGGPAFAGLNLIADAVENGSLGVSSSSQSGATITTSWFKGQSVASVFAQGMGVTQILNSRFDGSATAILVQESWTTGLNFSTFGLQSTDISNCTSAAITLVGPYASADARTLSGTGNAVGLLISRGARAVIGSSVTLTGTTEVSIDGAASSWVTMRSSTPKVISNPNYFTAFYE